MIQNASSSHLITTSLDERVGEKEHQGDHEAINGQGLHECQGQQQDTSQVICNLWPQELAALPKQLTNPTSGLAEFIGQNILTGLTSGISSISHCEKLSASFSSESRHSDSLKCSWKQ